jgi:hypothetical protein
MTNKEIKKRLLIEMKKDDVLKPYVKDIDELSQKSFATLIKVLKKCNEIEITKKGEK